MRRRRLTTRDVAERYSVAPDTILRWVEERGLPAMRLTSRAIRYDEDELEEWERGHSTGAAERGVSPTRSSRAQARAYGAESYFLPSPTRPPTAAENEEEQDAC